MAENRYRHELKEGTLRIDVSPDEVPTVKLLFDAMMDTSYSAVYKYDELRVICSLFANLDDLRHILNETPQVSVSEDLVAVQFVAQRARKKPYEVDFYLTKMPQPITVQLRVENAKLKQRVETLEADAAYQKIQLGELAARLDALESRDL
jgi:hypothetical protein